MSRAPEATLWDLVIAQAARTPQAPAVRQWDERLSYRELVGSAAALGARLRELGVRPESRVGICAHRSVLLPVGVLGVLAAGGAYVVLDPAHPRRRLDDIVADGALDVVVVDDAGKSLLAGAGCELVELATGASEPVDCPARPQNAAYVLFTSGSTGRPKGVVVSHRSVRAFVTASAQHFDLGPDCRSIAFSALGFDVSVLDMLTPLTVGGCVQLIGDADRTDPARLQRFLEAHDVTWGFVPPALLPLLEPARLPPLRDVVTAGEPPGPEQVARWAAPPGRRLHNWYGPTEATVCVVGCELTGDWDRPVPIGRPLAGCQAYVLDERQLPCPQGIPGELYLGGPQVARGYLGQPALTAERFVPDPFGPPGSRLFRTGDRAVCNTDGQIELLGRLDRQVKVQGQRVEIGEVETVLLRHPQVLQAAVDVVGGNGHGGTVELVAFLTPAGAPDIGELRAHCAERLPGYMVPTQVHRLDALPLTPSGKTDLRALGELVRTAAMPTPPSRSAHSKLSAETFEDTVADVWSQVLPDPHPAPEHDFLAVGGHSLRAMRLVSALRARLHRDITVADVYAGHTLAGLAQRLAAAPAIDDDTTVRTGNPPALSAAQRRMWFVEHLAPDTPAHNISMAERLRGPLDVDALRLALRAVAARHQTLRWRVPQRDGVPYVAVAEAGTTDAPLTVADLAGNHAALRELIDAEAVTPFDLAAGPLWRTTLARLAADDHVLVITVHHLVFDGWSQDVLYRDLAAAYAAPRREQATPTGQVAALPAEFGDYVAALARRGARHGREHLDWWVERLRDAPVVCDLPRDRTRPATQTFRGDTRQADVDSATAAAVQALAKRLNTTAHAVLITAFGQLLRRLTGQQDLLVGVPYADRDDLAFEPLIGNLLQILPVRLRAVDGDSFAAHVRRSSDEVAAAIAHRDAPLERMVEALRVPRDLSRNPLIQVLFNMYEFTGGRLSLVGCESAPVPAGLPGSLFDLTLYVNESPDSPRGWRLQVVYNTDLYDAERIDGYLGAYLHLLRQLADAPDDPVENASARVAHAPLPDWRTPLSTATAAKFPPGVLEQVAQSAKAYPDDMAITGVGGDLTYRDVAELQNRVAAGVTAAGCAAGDTVAVLANRHATLPAIMLGVFGTGARWAILDAALPAERLARQAAAVNAKWLLSCPDAVCPDELRHLIAVEPVDAVPSTVPSPERSYLSFTSGTTGEPQAVLSPESPLAGFIAWHRATFQLGRSDRFALLAGLAHDPLLRDAFTPLAAGATLAVPPQELLRDPVRLLAWLHEQRITVAHLTPQLGRMVTTTPLANGPELPTSHGSAAALPDLRLVAVAGDRLTAADAARLRALAPNARLVNFYGTTETPQAHGWHEVTDRPAAEFVPVGRGLAGSELLVLDRLGRPAAAGELGEVVVRSTRLATGYLDRELTVSRFGVTPGASDRDDRYYRTGDLGRHQPNGDVVITGRADDQVKVRGFRVELGEIETALTAHADVRAAAALAVDGTGESAIRAFVAPAQPDVGVDTLLGYLRARLPDYAVPAELVLVPAIPLTPNGKLDRRALLATTAPRSRSRPADQELRTPTERLVATCWRAALGRPRIGAEENFFEVGGHSLALVVVATRLSTALHREIAVIDLFHYPTIRALAAYLDGDGHDPGLDRAARRVAMRRERLRHRRNTNTGTPTGGRRP